MSEICLTSYVPSGQSASGTRLTSKVPTLEAIKKKRKELNRNYLLFIYFSDMISRSLLMYYIQEHFFVNFFPKNINYTVSVS
jgi:hypothetical protein